MTADLTGNYEDVTQYDLDAEVEEA